MIYLFPTAKRDSGGTPLNRRNILATAVYGAACFAFNLQVGSAQTQSTAPPIFVSVEGSLQNTVCGNYCFTESRSYVLNPASPTVQPFAGWTVSGSFGATSSQLTFSGFILYDWNVDSCPYGCYVTLTPDPTAYVYVRGPVGTEFSLQYTKTGTASVSVDSGGTMSANADVASAGASAPGSDSHSGSFSTPVPITGTSSLAKPAIAYANAEYTYAYTIPISLGLNFSICPTPCLYKG